MSDENFVFKPENWRDPDLTADLRTAGLTFLESHPSGIFILDFSRCKSVYSRVIGVVVLLHNKFVAEKRTLKIVNVRYEVWKVFDVMNLTALLNMDDVIRDDDEGAKEAPRPTEQASATLKVDFETCQGTGVFIFTGKIHSSQDSATFLNIINKIIQDKERMLIDMKGVKYVDSLAIGVLARLVKLTHEGKAFVRFCGASEMLMEIFKTSNLDKMIKIYDNREAALSGWN